MARLLALWPDETQIGAWGRKFGVFVQTSEQATTAKPVRSFVLALRAYGDAYYVECCKARKRRATQSQEAAQRQHETQFMTAYQTYLQESEQRIRQHHPEQYECFEQHEQEQRVNLENSALYKGNLLRVQLRVFDSPERHLERLREYFRDITPELVYDFKAWDTHLNSQRLDVTTRQ